MVLGILVGGCAVFVMYLGYTFKVEVWLCHTVKN